jgi:hypothetical protein
LAGDFLDCIFILGIDSEIIASALEVTHNDILSKMPEYSSGTPLGRRFMDKFIQLPITIPTPDENDKTNYIENLIKKNKNKDGEPSYNNKDIIEKINKELKNYSDNNEDIAELMIDGASNFSDNPREIKRFMNTFRFQYFLLKARQIKSENKVEDPLSKYQLKRWVILSLKWPELVRWLQWYMKNHKKDSEQEHAGLKILEDIYGSDDKIDDYWKDNVSKTLELNINNSKWFMMKVYVSFFKRKRRIRITKV